MFLTAAVLETLTTCVILTVLAAFITVVCSVVCGATLAFYARPTVRYGVVLALLFLPFATGEGVWAYSISRLFHACGIQNRLLLANTSTRATALLLVCLARTVPLGIFFCATTLQRYVSEIRAYSQIHQLRLPFFLLCGVRRVPPSIIVLLGLFGGSLVASEASLAVFLYHANPGTPPETMNIMLGRMFREIYASLGPESLPKIAVLGIVISGLLLSAAVLGTLAGKEVLSFLAYSLRRFGLTNRVNGTVIALFSQIATSVGLIPGLVGLMGLILPIPNITVYDSALERIIGYYNIVALGLFIGSIITTLSIALAVKLRYSDRNGLAILEGRWTLAAVLLLAVLGVLGSGEVGISAYLALIVSHVALHYSVFQFICMALIADIPEFHVAWQRTMKMSYFFSVMTDGFKRHSTVILSLIGLGTVQVVTDGSISRWFAHLVKSPEEALYAAVFGRLSSAADATIIAWSVAIVAIIICGVLATTYVHQLRDRPRYA
jgi:hypothetical protein